MAKQMVKGYIGMFKQPLQKPEVDSTTMFAVIDEAKIEMELIILTPGSFACACRAIREMNPRRVSVFFPSLREEYISDIFNLYMTMKDELPIKWVFPKKYRGHSTFLNGQITTVVYTNSADSSLSVRYEENPNVEDVYDIIVKNKNGTHVFSQNLDFFKLDELSKDPYVTYIHVPASSSVYGGLTYLDIVKEYKDYYHKVIPHSYSSIEEYYDIIRL